jgi:hypothetical protein
MSHAAIVAIPENLVYEFLTRMVSTVLRFYEFEIQAAPGFSKTFAGSAFSSRLALPKQSISVPSVAGSDPACKSGH